MSIKKFISIMLVSCIGIGVFSNKSHALDDSLLKFLINSSYPEAKVDTPKEIKEESDSEESKDENTSSNKDDNKNEDDFIKMYIGEENIPKTPSVSNVTTTKGAAINNVAYKNNILVTSQQPKVLIYHTHGGETYFDSPEGNYHSEDKENSTLEMGALLTQELTKRGVGVVHNTTYHDIPNFNGAYSRSLQTIKSMQSTYDSIDIVIDLHRDGRDFNKMPKEEFHDLTTTQINGEDVAKFCFVYGERSENVSTIKALAEDITSFAENKYPGITRPVVPKKNAKFNQFTSNNHLLIEVGGNANTTQEAKVSVPYIADVISEYFKQKGI